MKGETVVTKVLRDRPILFGYIALMVTAEAVLSVMRAFGWIH